MNASVMKNHRRSKSADELSSSEPEDNSDMQLATLTSNSSSSNGATATSKLIFGHRRSESLRQRFDQGLDDFVHILVEEAHQAELAVKNFCIGAWKVCHFSTLPSWLQDNDFIHSGHRPPLPSNLACLKSVFRLHTETGNIWTHGIGCVLFLSLAVYILTVSDLRWQDKLMMGVYFVGVVTCLLFSTLFHTYACHSPDVAKIWSKLDYCGISIQIIGSMIPAFYYGFYDNKTLCVVYMTGGAVLCFISIVVSLWDKFGEPRFRPLRAAVFLAFGLSGVIPGIHWFFILDSKLIIYYLLFLVQGLLYVIGALLYALRIPERYFPGKCDYWFQSHQIFHVLVVLAAIVHLNGIYGLANVRTRNDIAQFAVDESVPVLAVS